MRHNREYWRRHVEAWRKSGLTQKAYCERHDLKKGTLGYWSSKLRSEAQGELVEVGRIDVDNESGRAQPARPIELVVEGRYLLRLWPGTERRHLGDVLEVLEDRQ